MTDTNELKHLTECDRDMLKSALAWKSIANAAHNEGFCIGRGMAPNERDESGVSANQYMNAYGRMENESDKAILVIANELNGLRADNERLTQENAALRELVERLPKSKDGVPVIADGMILYCPYGHPNKLSPNQHRVYCTQGDCWDEGCQGDSGSGSVWNYGQCTAILNGGAK